MTREQMERIAINMLTCVSLKDAAKKSGISYSTLYKLRKREDFQEVVNDTKNQIFGEAMTKAQVYTLEAMDTLREIMLDKAATDSSRVAAGRSILEIGLYAHGTWDEILTKLALLEGQHNED